MKTDPNIFRRSLAPEKKFWAAGFQIVIGLDEAGRGPLAGPVAAGAVAIVGRGASLRTLKVLLAGIDDSKKLTARRRQEMYELLVAHKQIIWGCGLASVAEIDKINILGATKLAMERAAAKVVAAAGFGGAARIALVLDGNFTIASDLPQTSVVGGDSKVFSIAAASIIAKVTRDRIMERLDKKYPGWNFETNKGYPTARHRRLLEERKPCLVHRRSFAPVLASWARQAKAG